MAAEIWIYNTMSGKKELLQPVHPDRVGIYACGITAYDRCHIGHARSAVVFDVVVKHLRNRGYQVTFVRNFTDIDDKIINRAKEEGISPSELAEREIINYYKDMDELGVARADIEPRATEHIPEIVQLIERLIKKGYAYESGGDVYFAVKRFKEYGKLSKRDIDELMAGARIKPGDKKRDPMDFALWKASKPGEPTWNSPWGPGRPGWHIECSAMSMKYLGDTIDIHGGGLDLSFPHHENELALSEAATGKPFVKIWMHNGFVTIKGEKMSKSLGNFITIHEILSKFHPEVLRLFLLSKHYRSPLDYSTQALLEWRVALDRIYNAMLDAEKVVESPVKKQRPLSQEVQNEFEEICSLKERFNRAMDDDFNSAMAIGAIFDSIRALNRITQQAQKTPSALFIEPVQKSMEIIRDLSKILGILMEDPKRYVEARNMEALKAAGLDLDQLNQLIQKRNMARREKNWQLADEIRDSLREKGIILMDTPKGTEWTAIA